MVIEFRKNLGVKNSWDLQNHLKEFGQLKLLVSQNAGQDRIKSFELVERVVRELEWCTKTLKPLVVDKD